MADPRLRLGVCYYPPMAFGRKPPPEPAPQAEPERDPSTPGPETGIPEAWAARLDPPTSQVATDEAVASAFGGTDPDNAPTEAVERPRITSHDEEW